MLKEGHQYLHKKGKSSEQLIDEPLVQLIDNEFSYGQNIFDKNELQEDSLQILEIPREEGIHEMFSYQLDEYLSILHTCQDQIVSREHIYSSFKDSD